MRPVELNAANRRLDGRRSFDLWQLDGDRAVEGQRVENQIARFSGPSDKEFPAQAAGGIACERLDLLIDACDLCGVASRQIGTSQFQPIFKQSHLLGSDRLLIQNGGQGVILRYCVEFRSTDKVPSKAADRIALFGGNRLDQKRRKVFRFLKPRVASRIVGLLEKLSKGDEPPKDRVVAMNSFEILPERIADLRPASPDDCRRLVLLHRFGDAGRKAKKAGRAVDGERNSRGRIERGAVATLPTDPAFFGVGIEPVVERHVKRSTVAEAIQDHRQKGAHSVAATTPNRREAAQRSLKHLAPALEVPQEGGERHERHWSLAPFASNDLEPSGAYGFPKLVDQCRPLSRDRFQVGRGEQHAHRHAGRDRPLEMSVGQSRNHQTQVDQVKLDRVKPFARFGQGVEAVLKTASSLLGVAGDCRVSPRDCLPPKVTVVEPLEMVHSPAE